MWVYDTVPYLTLMSLLPWELPQDGDVLQTFYVHLINGVMGLINVLHQQWSKYNGAMESLSNLSAEGIVTTLEHRGMRKGKVTIS